MDLTQKSEVPRIFYLDGLRGLAAFMVLLAHLMISVYPAVVTFLPREMHAPFEVTVGLSPFAVLWTGNFGVCIFFVLSGYVLSDFCQRTTLSFPAQLARRYCRLAFPMLLTSTLAWALLHAGLYNNLIVSKEITHSGWLGAWYNFDPQVLKMLRESLVNAFVRAHAKYNCNLWSMHYELIGSAYVFALFTLLKNRYLRSLALTWFMAVNYQGYYLLFAWGVLLYDFQPEINLGLQRLLPFKALRRIYVLVGLLMALYLGGVPDVQPGMTAPWHAWLSKTLSVLQWHMLGSMLLVMLLLQSIVMQKALGSSLGRFLGKISFVLYLIQVPIICTVTAWTLYFTRGLPYYQMALIASLTTIVVVVFLSNLLYRYVDQYATGASRWIGKWVDQRLAFKHKKELDVAHHAV